MNYFFLFFVYIAGNFYVISGGVMSRIFLCAFFVRYSILLSALSLFSISQVLADTQISIADQKQADHHIFIRNDQIRVTYAQGKQSGYMIFSSLTKEIVLVNDQNKTYSIIDQARLQSLMLTINTLQQTLLSQMDSLPPEQKKALAGLLPRPGSSGSAEPKERLTLKQVDQKKQINGYSCDVSHAFKSNQKVSEYCLAPVSRMGIPKKDHATMVSFYSFVNDVVNQFPFLTKAVEVYALFDQLKDNFPMEVIIIEQGKPVNSYQVKTISSDPLSALLFEIPKNYVLKPIELPAQSTGGG